MDVMVEQDPIPLLGITSNLAFEIEVIDGIPKFFKYPRQVIFPDDRPPGVVGKIPRTPDRHQAQSFQILFHPRTHMPTEDMVFTILRYRFSFLAGFGDCFPNNRIVTVFSVQPHKL